MKAGWDAPTLEAVATFSNGLWKGKKGPFRIANVLRNTNFRPNGALSFDDVAELEVEISQFEKRQLAKGDIILERSGGGPKQPVGRVALFDIDAAGYSFSNFTSVIRLKPESRIDAKYLHHLLNWWYLDGRTEQIQSNSTSIRNLDFRAYKSFSVTRPPLEEQQRIVAILDEAFEGLDRARANAEANLENARELFERILDISFSSFSGEVKERKLADLISISHGFAFKSEDFCTSTDASLPIVLTPGNYTEDACLEFTDKNTKRFTGDVAPDFLFERGELTVVMTDLSSKMKILGKPAFIGSQGILHNQRIGRIRFKSNDLHPRFLFHFLRTQAAQRPIRDTATGTMVRHTAPKRILNITIRTPVAFSDQERIAAKIDEVEAETIRMRTQYTKALQNLADLRQSLLQKAFAGELT